MIKGKTSSGFEYEIEDEALDDYELFEAICQVDEGNYGAIAKMVDSLLGEKQKKALKEHIRSESGRVSTTKIINEVTEIFKSNKAGKN